MYDNNSSKFWPLPANMLFHAAYLVYLISFSSMFNRIYASITYEKKMSCQILTEKSLITIYFEKLKGTKFESGRRLTLLYII